MSGERVVVGQFVSLFRYRLCNFSPAIPDIDAVEASKAIDVTTSLRVLDPDAFTARYDCGIAQLAAREFLELSGRVQNAGAIELGNRADLCHGIFFPSLKLDLIYYRR